MKTAEEIAFLSLNPAIIKPHSQQILASRTGRGGRGQRDGEVKEYDRWRRSLGTEGTGVMRDV